MSLFVEKLDRYDMVNNPQCDSACFNIWFAGCTFHCEDCQNPQLWDKKSGGEWNVADLYSIVMFNCQKFNYNTVVLLGGEPLQQNKEELLSLCQLLSEKHIDIWVYTGYELEQVDKELLKYIHTIKCGRYIKELRQDGFPASSNQKVYRSIAGDLKDITSKFKEEY